MAHAQKHVEELLKLPRDERSAAAEALLASLEDDDADGGAEQSWAEEIERRVAEHAPGIPAEQVFAEGRARLKKDA
jgi:putative addiction module component (TIGR02574 family)